MEQAKRVRPVKTIIEHIRSKTKQLETQQIRKKIKIPEQLGQKAQTKLRNQQPPNVQEERKANDKEHMITEPQRILRTRHQIRYCMRTRHHDQRPANNLIHTY